MTNQPDNDHFPQQSESGKIHGTHDDRQKQEKYLRETGKIEDYPEDAPDHVAKMSAPADPKNDSTHLTDVSGEEKKEDYINTDERKRDLRQQGLED